MKSALNEKCFHGFGSIFGRIWVHILGGKCICFRKHKYSQPLLQKVLSKTKSASKIRRRQKVLSNIARLQGSFRKNEKCFKFTKGTGGPGEKFFQKQKVLQKIRRIQKILSNMKAYRGSFRKNEKFFKFAKRTGGPGEKFFQKQEDCRKCFQI